MIHGHVVTELQARIDKLSADIDLQKEILKTLERSKIAIQRELNPSAIQWDGFPSRFRAKSSCYAFPHALRLEQSIFPCCFSISAICDICNTWTDIALATPELWAAIHMDKELADRASLLRTWLNRAGSRKLSISLPTDLTEDITTVIRCHGHQLQGLKIFYDRQHIDLVTAAGPFLLLEL
ncbi:hypothetical protein B0H17DRAFT_1212962 [Mycena rosella]|uniref:F-box domain-containing protein n=1 Tax=Mycena rosella TaxID=1033263 RepID=A0AAD7CR71_MYCRO|nr:hypothetical protein B0H17DRAFT_1212962 [Mycena rosella]